MNNPDLFILTLHLPLITLSLLGIGLILGDWYRTSVTPEPVVAPDHLSALDSVIYERVFEQPTTVLSSTFRMIPEHELLPNHDRERELYMATDTLQRDLFTGVKQFISIRTLPPSFDNPYCTTLRADLGVVQLKVL